jgi:hypothetical protein
MEYSNRCRFVLDIAGGIASPPDVRSGCLHHEVQKVFQKRNPLIWEFVKDRKIFVDGAADDLTGASSAKMGVGLGSRLTTWA